jgi:hypothetical protein
MLIAGNQEDRVFSVCHHRRRTNNEKEEKRGIPIVHFQQNHHLTRSASRDSWQQDMLINLKFNIMREERKSIWVL